MSTKSSLGTVCVRDGEVRWTMEAGEARDLADWMEESIDNPDDIAHRAVEALREAADEIDGGES